jgi:hypothetical protein
MALASMGCWSKRALGAAFFIPSVAADGHKVAVFGLDGKQPLEGDEPHIDHVAALHPLAGQQQGMGQFAVGIVQGVLKPGPIVCCMVFKLIEKPVGKNFRILRTSLSPENLSR